MVRFKTPMIPTSTQVDESVILNRSVDKVWCLVRKLDFATLFPGLVSKSVRNNDKVNSNVIVTFVDGTIWEIRMTGMNDLSHSVSWELVSANPPTSYLSRVDTISVQRVTAKSLESSFLKWSTTFSSDSGASVIQDCKLKKREALQKLRLLFSCDMQLSNIDLMDGAACGFDIVIVCTSNTDMENFWQLRLNLARGSIIPINTIVVVVTEDWDGGAGNGLGTLYAFQKAVKKAETVNGVNLNTLLSEGASAALYHTAGKGTRLAPLPGSECNNKPAVKLPGLVCLQGVTTNIPTKTPVTILESVIRQTGVCMF